MENSDFDRTGTRDITSAEILDLVSAAYDLEIQRHREQIQRLRRQQAASESTKSTVDFVVRVRRAA